MYIPMKLALSRGLLYTSHFGKEGGARFIFFWTADGPSPPLCESSAYTAEKKSGSSIAWRRKLRRPRCVMTSNVNLLTQAYARNERYTTKSTHHPKIMSGDEAPALVPTSGEEKTPKPLGMRKNGRLLARSPRCSVRLQTKQLLTILPAGKQWHEPKKAFRPTKGLTTYEKRTKERAAMLQMKAKEKELKDDKEQARKVSPLLFLCPIHELS